MISKPPLSQTSHFTIPKECAACVLELKYLPNPRSPSLTTPAAVINTLLGLMSVELGLQSDSKGEM